jgi:glycogen synthase
MDYAPVTVAGMIPHVRVLVVTNMYPPHHLGGYELSCQDVLRRWSRRGHHVSVLTTDFRVPDAGPGNDDGIPVCRELEWYWRDHAFLRPRLPTRFAIERRNQRRLKAALQRERPDVVSVWHLGGMSTSLLTTLVRRKTPVVHVICDEWPIYAPQVDPWVRPWRDRPRLARIFAAATGVPTAAPPLPQTGHLTFVSGYLRSVVAASLGFPVEDAEVIPSGIDPDDFPLATVATAREWHGRLLCVGRVEPRKGFHVAVEAIAALPDTTLAILGPAEPGYRDELLDRAGVLGVAERVRLGAVPRAELAGHYRQADALLFTSSWQEPFGLVPLEAMAVGTPVVATGTGGSAEFCHDGVNCLLVPAGDPDALADAVRRLAGDPDLRQRLRRGGVETAAHYTADRYAEQLEAAHAMMTR